jgi:hypothetical protein
LTWVRQDRLRVMESDIANCKLTRTLSSCCSRPMHTTLQKSLIIDISSIFLSLSDLYWFNLLKLGWTSVHHACRSNALGVLDRLIALGGDPRAVANGADVAWVTASNPYTPLFLSTIALMAQDSSMFSQASLQRITIYLGGPYNADGSSTRRPGRHRTRAGLTARPVCAWQGPGFQHIQYAFHTFNVIPEP